MLKAILSPLSDSVYVIMRVVVGVLFAFHGMQKVLGILGESQPVMSQLWIGGLIELIGGTLIAVGFQTRWAAFLSSGTMAVAYCQFHWDFRFDEKFFPAVNAGELAVVYAFLFLYIACRGAGGMSIDKGT